MTTSQRTWQTAYEEVKADLDRAVARNNELADAGDAANTRIQELEQEKVRLEEENRRIPGLERGNRDARLLVETVHQLLRQKVGNAEVQRQLREKTTEAEELKKRLEELVKVNESGERRPRQATPKDLQNLAESLHREENGDTAPSGSEQAE